MFMRISFCTGYSCMTKIISRQHGLGTRYLQVYIGVHVYTHNDTHTPEKTQSRKLLNYFVFKTTTSTSVARGGAGAPAWARTQNFGRRV